MRSIRLATQSHIYVSLSRMNDQMTVAGDSCLYKVVVTVLSSGLALLGGRGAKRDAVILHEAVWGCNGCGPRGISPVSRKPPGPRRIRWPTTIFRPFRSRDSLARGDVDPTSSAARESARRAGRASSARATGSIIRSRPETRAKTRPKAQCGADAGRTAAGSGGPRLGGR